MCHEGVHRRGSQLSLFACLQLSTVVFWVACVLCLHFSLAKLMNLEPGCILSIYLFRHHTDLLTIGCSQLHELPYPGFSLFSLDFSRAQKAWSLFDDVSDAGACKNAEDVYSSGF